jgi:glyoxylate reductase
MTNQSIEPVLITRRIPDVGLDLLRERGLAFAYRNEEEPAGAEELARLAPGRAGIICQIGDRFDRALLEQLSPTCRVISTISVGYDHIDVAAAHELRITVTNTPDVLTETTADLAWALLLAVARRIPESERHLRSGEWNGWGILQFLGVDVFGKTLGIVGGGRIGAAVARRGAGFGMTTLCHTRSPERSGMLDGSSMPAGTRFVDLPTLMRESEFVSLHCPLTPVTKHLISAEMIALMKPSAVLINTARGPVVDETALIAALKDKRIFGAGFDVYEHEPRVPDALMALENAVLLPHIGSASGATRDTMTRLCAEAVATGIAGGVPANVV